MADHDARLHPSFIGQSGQAKTQSLDSDEIDLFAQAPARIVLAKAGRTDEGFSLEFGCVGAQVLAGEGETQGRYSGEAQCSCSEPDMDWVRGSNRYSSAVRLRSPIITWAGRPGRRPAVRPSALRKASTWFTGTVTSTA